MAHKSGFVNIIGHPNVGKSTLLNALLDEKLSVITNKPQTTRHRIIAIYNDPDHQIVFSDTPGWIEDPGYKMQEVMNRYTFSTFEDGDLFITMVDPTQKASPSQSYGQRLKRSKAPKYLIINKIDLFENDPDKIREHEQVWTDEIAFDRVFHISALHKLGLDSLLESIKNDLPEGPEYYPKDQLTDRPERFFITEIIRGHILEQYHQEIPYSVNVEIEEFQETTLRDEPFARIRALIYVSRKTQKGIIIGKQGSAIKALGTAARKDIEEFLGYRVHLELYVKIKDDWRNDERLLKQFGYQ